MTRAARYAYLVLAWAFVVGLVFQVFFIGMALFDGAENRETHRALGWILHLAPLLILAAAALSRAGARHWQWALALAAVTFIVPILATLKDAPFAAAFHPVGAVVAFWLAIVVAQNSLAAVRQADARDDEAARGPATAA
jgi:hypothetical protein